MKTILFLFIFLFLITGINAQEAVNTNSINKAAVIQEDHTNTTQTKVNLTNITIENDMCYAELSKIAFYEALIRQNGFEIDLNENTTPISLKNTEDIITNNQERISYSD